MKSRIANKIIRSVGFHSFEWEGNRKRLIGTAYRRYRWSFGQISEAFKHRTIYPPRPKCSVEIRMFEDDSKP